MAGSCCNRPLTKIIRVGTAQVGIMGFRDIMEAASTSPSMNDGDLAEKLLADLKRRGNYVSPGSEGEYKAALLDEYHHFVADKRP